MTRPSNPWLAALLIATLMIAAALALGAQPRPAGPAAPAWPLSSAI